MPADATLSAQNATARRVHVNFAPSTYEALKAVAERKGVTMSEALRQAIALSDFITRELERGAELTLNRDGKSSRLVIP